MTSSKFDRAIPIILRFEGGYVNDPDDPGGETKYGISKRAYPHLDIRALTIPAAKEIYFADYWTPCGAEDLEWPLTVNVFDAAVNNGLRRAKEWLAETHDLPRFLAIREAFFRDIAARKPKSRKFLPGWLRRLNILRGYK